MSTVVFYLIESTDSSTLQHRPNLEEYKEDTQVQAMTVNRMLQQGGAVLSQVRLDWEAVVRRYVVLVSCSFTFQASFFETVS